GTEGGRLQSDVGIRAKTLRQRPFDDQRLSGGLSGVAERKNSRFPISQPVNKVRVQVGGRAVVAQKSLQFATGRERTHVYLQSPQSRIRRGRDLEFGSHGWNPVSLDTGGRVGHRRSWRSIAPTVAVEIV